MSLIGKAYQKFDNSMMYLANKAVHAWNWTTGKGKASLANSTNFLGLATAVSGQAARSLASTVIVSLVGIPSSLFCRDMNNKIEYDDERSLHSGCLSLESERLKKGYFYQGSYGLVCAGGLSALACIPDGDIVSQVGDYASALGLFLWNSQFYIMRTDYMPPRKNCIKRGIDWAKAKLEKIAENTRVPEPAFAPAGDIRYFDYYANQEKK